MSRPCLLLLLLFLGPLLGTSCVEENPRTPLTDSSGVVFSEAPVPFSSDTALGPEGDVPFVETPQRTVNKMLELANVSDEDVVYDLGSGDGRIVITAARKYGARGVGIEIKPPLVDRARKNAKKAEASDRVAFQQGDLFEADISEATVVTLYLLPSINKKLRPKLLRELAPGTRVVSHDFDMDEWEPDTTWSSDGETVFLWTVPEEPPSFVKEK